MSALKQVLISANILYGLILLIFLLDFFGIMEMKGREFSSFIYIITTLFMPLILIGNLIVFRKYGIFLTWRFWSSLVTLTICFYSLAFLAYRFSSTNFQTQTIYYVSFQDCFRTIEFQMEDIGVFGYNKRYVEVTYLTPWLMITKQVDPKNDPGEGWVRIDWDVNELELKY